MEEKKQNDEIKEQMNTVDERKEAPAEKKKTNWKGIWAIILVMAIGYGAGFGTLALANWLNERNETSTECTECTENDDEIVGTDVEYPVAVKKPVIYLYPTQETYVEVKLGNPDLITCSYPEYNNGWKVTALPDGHLIHDGDDLYSLYYEADMYQTTKMSRTGFMVKRTETADFLEEKLTQLGLNYKEKQEFIIYWLPILQQNPYNYIYFAFGDEVDDRMPLNISPAPDTTIRIWMYYQGLDKPFSTNEQELPTYTRQGFTVVEWGGAEINTVRHKLLKTGPIINLPPYSIRKGS